MQNGICPRCGCRSLEYLATHCHCWECGYSPDLERPITRIKRKLESEALHQHRFADALEEYHKDYQQSLGNKAEEVL